jgi:hypothetical protein
MNSKLMSIFFPGLNLNHSGALGDIHIFDAVNDRFGLGRGPVLGCSVLIYKSSLQFFKTG